MPIPDSAAETGRPQLALLVYPGFSEFEVTVALALLARTHDIVNVGLTREPIRGEGGLRVLPDRTLADIQPEEFAAVLIPGAVDMGVVADVPALNTFVRGAHTRGKVIGAICGGPLVLGLAGLFDSIPYTVTFNHQQRAVLGAFPEAGFVYRDVIRSGNVITAQGHAFAEFGVTLAQALGAVRDVEGVRTFYRGLGNPGMEAEFSGSTVVSE